ncbi:MAG: DUF4178 domain-containing protein [Cyanobacteria bacterium J06642_2]
MIPLSVFWVLMLAIVAAVGLTYWRRSRRLLRTKESSRNLSQAPSIFELRLGDIVQYFERDWVVEGRLLYDEDGFTWLEYMLQDGDDIRWLSVEEDDWVTVALMTTVSDLELENPPPKELTYRGDRYRCTDSGTAQMRREGNLRRPNAERCNYYDYEGPEKKVLSVEDWDGDIEISAGDIIAPAALTILPGEGNSVYR